MGLIFSQVGVLTIAASSLMLLALSIAAIPALARAVGLPIKPATHRPSSAPAGLNS